MEKEIAVDGECGLPLNDDEKDDLYFYSLVTFRVEYHLRLIFACIYLALNIFSMITGRGPSFQDSSLRL